MAASLCLQLYDQINVLIVQVLVNGKISQAAMVGGAGYRNGETFKLQTGITKTRLIKDKIHHDTKVYEVQDIVCCAIMSITCTGPDTVKWCHTAEEL